MEPSRSRRRCLVAIIVGGVVRSGSAAISVAIGLAQEALVAIDAAEAFPTIEHFYDAHESPGQGSLFFALLNRDLVLKS